MDPDWFFYLCKELSHVLTTYLKDLRVLKSLLSNQDEGLSSFLPHSLISQTDHLVSQISSLMREKEIWEEGRHGLEIINLCGKYFQNQEDVYFGYCKNLEEILTRICEDYSCYLPVEGVCVRPIVFCQYYIESFCRECRCCGNLGGLKKVNFSPVLEKKSATGLDGNLLVKLHNTHVLLNRILDPYHKVSLRLLTVIKVQELTREMEGFSGIARGNDLGLMDLTGEFLKQGILLKLNKRKGLQNRIFFLFRDMLVYGTRVSSSHGFRLHGIILTRNMELLDSNISISSIPWSFSVIVRSSDGMGEDGGDKPNEKILVLAAFSSKDHGLWVQSISSAIEGSVNAQAHGNPIVSRLFNSSEELLNNNLKLSTEQIGSSNSQMNAHHNRANALSHVCWHRNISIRGCEIVDKERHQISGPLLRKFKNSPGWQRLWVVFTTVCLYFYKSANETVPLASLPLLGYKIELLSDLEKTQILKEHVFKLVFKNHVYYFRAESRYTFGRWVLTLSNACVERDS